MAGDLGSVVVLGIVLLALAVFLLVKGINLVCRVIAAHSENKLLWVLVGCVFLFGLIAVGTGGEPLAIILFVVSVFVLLLTCRILDLYYANSLQTQGRLVESVLRPGKWWQPVSPDAALAA
jgi:thiol:disulfide interchange protein